MSGGLANKVALVTGGGSGIGLATAEKFATEGAQTIITGRHVDSLDAAVAKIGDNAVGIQGDVSKLDDLNRLFQKVKREHGRIDVVFANAGIAQVSPFEHVEESFYDRHFDINAKGLFFTVQKAIPLTKEGASIILCGSVLGQKGMANLSVYNATKAAVRSFARTWAEELRERDVRVNVVSPGPIETPMFNKLGMTPEQVQQMGQELLPQIPLGRLGQAEEIANTALFLASDASSFVNGAELAVDGGMAQI